MRNAYKILVGKPDRWIDLGIERRILEKIAKSGIGFKWLKIGSNDGFL
jgi:hypothetical protein